MYPSDKTELYFNKVRLSGRIYSIYVFNPSPHRLCLISWLTSPDDQTKMIREMEYRIPLEARVKKNNDGVSVRRHRCVQVSSFNISHKFRDASGVWA